MKKKQEGYCHICGNYGELSFEHIPPENALNNHRAMVYTGEEAIKRYNGEKSRYINQQQGMGRYTLCENCNNNTGAWYADVYNNVAKDVACSLHKNKQLEHGDVVEFSFKKLPALEFAKQVVTMFCSLLPLSEVQRLGFDKFLLVKTSNAIDKSLFDLRIYLTPHSVGQLMVGPSSIVSKTARHRFFASFCVLFRAFSSEIRAFSCRKVYNSHVVQTCKWSRLWSDLNPILLTPPRTSRKLQPEVDFLLLPL